MVFAALAAPILHVLQLYDGFVRRLAGVRKRAETQQTRCRRNSSKTSNNADRWAVDEEEQEMIENS